MPEGYPRMYADDRGVWRVDKPGQPFGIEWGEVASISASKFDGITEEYTVVELEFEFGEWLELHAAWPGFRRWSGPSPPGSPASPQSGWAWSNGCSRGMLR